MRKLINFTKGFMHWCYGKENRKYFFVYYIFTAISFVSAMFAFFQFGRLHEQFKQFDKNLAKFKENEDEKYEYKMSDKEISEL